jgi:hypothetical protein
VDHAGVTDEELLPRFGVSPGNSIHESPVFQQTKRSARLGGVISRLSKWHRSATISTSAMTLATIEISTGGILARINIAHFSL